MDTPDLDRLTLLERAQLLHDATLRRHGEMLEAHDESRLQHEGAMRKLQAMEASLNQILASMEARARLWRGEDGFDGD
jgi:hypothetical protein